MSQILPIMIVLVCFYDALIMLFIPSSATFIMAEDGLASHLIATLCAVAIGLGVMLNNDIKKIDNRWMLFLLGCIVFSSFHTPNINFESIFIPKDPGIFNFKPMFEAFVYLLMFAGIASVALSKEHKYTIGVVLSWVGIIYSGYAIVQHLGFDQFYKLVNTSIDQLGRNPKDGGLVGQPVYAAALIAICFPFVMRFKPFFIVLPIIAILLIGNRSALFATACSSLFLFTNNKRCVFYVVVAYIAILAITVAIAWGHPNFHSFINATGRIEAWQLMIKDFLHPHFPGVHKSYILTGLGFGSFSVMFPFFNNSPFYQAHNEYLEVLYTLSFGGLFLFIKMIQHIFITVQNQCVCAALIAIAVCALTNPVWHVPQLQFITVLLIGLVYNKESHYVLGTVNTK